jgi:hypothetical protein
MEEWLIENPDLLPAILVAPGGAVVPVGTVDGGILGGEVVPAKGWPGLSALAFSPHYRQRMSHAVIAADGLGTTFQSKEVLSQNNNPATMMHEIGFRAHTGALVKDPERMYMIQDAFYDGSISGSGSVAIRPKDREALKHRNWKLSDPMAAAMYYVVFPAKTKKAGIQVDAWADNRQIVHLKGRSPFDSESSDEEYPGSAAASAYWGWDGIDFVDDLMDTRSHIARYCCLGSYEYTTGAGVVVRVKGMSHHGPVEDERGAMTRRYGNQTA